MYTVYILKSTISGKYYRGQTNNLERRLKEHNNKEELSAASDAPWEIVFKTVLQSRAEALKLEKKLKNITSRVKIEAFIKKNNSTSQGGPDATPKG